MHAPIHRVVLVSVCAVTMAAVPCIWDRDTLADELSGLPAAFDLVTGRWFTHVDAYYDKRRSTLPAHLRKHPDDLAAYDDLAVAHERLRDRDAAIAMMEEKAAALSRLAKRGEKIAEHRYRYHANLGTFLAHSGRFAEAILQLEEAVEINPEAHFGRERFQIDAIRYIDAARRDPSLWTKHNFLTFANYQFEKKYWTGMIAKLSFTERPKRQKDRSKHRWTTVDKAYTAVAGMLRFGGIEGAELYRAAGDLFLVRRHLNLAWWSYHRALERGHPAAKSLKVAIASIEKHWREAKRAVGGAVPKPDAALYKAVRDEAIRWRAAFSKAEVDALRQGADSGDPVVLRKLVAAADRAVPRRALPTARKDSGAGARSQPNEAREAQKQAPGKGGR